MIGSDVSIANKLEVKLGNIILVPGCEPISDFTSTSLAVNIDCNSSFVTLRDALEAIPGSTIVRQTNPSRLFFVLPIGPPVKPGCQSCQSIDDYYQILRDITPTKSQTSTAGACDTFDYGVC